jgi:hypothetical protein
LILNLLVSTPETGILADAARASNCSAVIHIAPQCDKLFLAFAGSYIAQVSLFRNAGASSFFVTFCDSSAHTVRVHPLTIASTPFASSLVLFQYLRFALPAQTTQHRSCSGSRKLCSTFAAALAEGMLTMLERRRDDWPAHLARKHRLEPQAPDALYDRPGRFPDFLAGLRRALHDDLIDLDFYGRALRAIDRRELDAETAVARLISAALDPAVLERLDRLGAGRHLGCYNWLLLDTRHVEQRAYVLSRLGCFAQFFADTLLDVSVDSAPPRANRFGQGHADGARFASWLARVVDSGQDRLVIGALAHRFGVAENTIRALWRRAPAALGTPPTWQLSGILRRLDTLPERVWPTDPGGWDRLMCHAASPA